MTEGGVDKRAILADVVMVVVMWCSGGSDTVQVDTQWNASGMEEMKVGTGGVSGLVIFGVDGVVVCVDVRRRERRRERTFRC